jgi:hypothetical protein
MMRAAQEDTPMELQRGVFLLHPPVALFLKDLALSSKEVCLEPQFRKSPDVVTCNGCLFLERRLEYLRWNPVLIIHSIFVLI